MNSIKFPSWQQFSQGFLARKSEHQPVLALSLENALQKVILPQKINLSEAGRTELRRYAFQKAGHAYGNGAFNLTDEKAKNIYRVFCETASKLNGELKTEQAFEKNPKIKIPKGLERLATVSATVMEKYIEPQEKKNVQNLLNQVNRINQTVTPVFAEQFPLSPNKINTIELLAKRLAYLNPKKGETYQIPFEGRIVEYQVEEMHLWMGMFAYGFKPVNLTEIAPPILVFSGTRLAMSKRGSLATLTADFDPRGVGYIAYNNGKKVISNWIQKTNRKVITTGHSLGGALARITAIDNPNRVEEAITFSAPGIPNRYGKAWKKLNAAQTAIKPMLYNFNHSEDKVPTFGQSYVGTNYQVICAVEKTVNKKFAFQRTIHNKKLFGRKVALLSKTYPKKGLKIWQQRALSIIPFIFCMTLLVLSRALFGIHTSKPYLSLFGPLRWAWRQLITDKFAVKYAKPTAAVAA